MTWLGFLASFVACSGRAAPTGDGGAGDPCYQLYARITACTAQVDCSKVLDAVKQAICTAVQQAYSMSYEQQMAQCRQQTPGHCDCSGTVLEQVKTMLACPLDPETCMCAAGLDGGN